MAETHEPAQDLIRLLRIVLRHNHTPNRFANSRLARGTWRHASPQDRQALAPDDELHAALRSLVEEDHARAAAGDIVRTRTRGPS